MPFHWYDMKYVEDEATLKSKDEELFNNLDNFELMYELHTNVRVGGEYKSFFDCFRIRLERRQRI